MNPSVRRRSPSREGPMTPCAGQRPTRGCDDALVAALSPELPSGGRRRACPVASLTTTSWVGPFEAATGPVFGRFVAGQTTRDHQDRRSGRVGPNSWPARPQPPVLVRARAGLLPHRVPLGGSPPVRTPAACETGVWVANVRGPPRRAPAPVGAHGADLPRPPRGQSEAASWFDVLQRVRQFLAFFPAPWCRRPRPNSRSRRHARPIRH